MRLSPGRDLPLTLQRSLGAERDPSTLPGWLKEGFFSLHGFVPMILISLLCEVVWGCSLYERQSKKEHSRVLNSRRTCPHVADVSHIAKPFVWKDSAAYEESTGNSSGAEQALENGVFWPKP